MILVSSPKKPFTYTAKNTARRQAIIADYKEEIDSLYAAVQKTTQPHISVPAEWTSDAVLEFIRVIVSEVLKRGVGDDEDIFESGCDRYVVVLAAWSARSAKRCEGLPAYFFEWISLQATWIRNTILNALEKTAAADPRAAPGSFVYQHPTIASLSAYVLELAEGAQSQRTTMDAEEVKQMKIDAMHAMLRKYGSDFQRRVASPFRRAVVEGGDVVLLTGTTGWLGSLMLAELLQEAGVERVYAVNRRGGGIGLSERQVRAFEDRGIDGTLVKSAKLVLLEADLTAGDLGLDAERLSEVSWFQYVFLTRLWY